MSQLPPTNEDAFDAFYRRYFRYIRALVAMRIMTHGDLEDLESIIWMDIFRQFARFDVPEPRGLLQQLVRWRARDLFRDTGAGQFKPHPHEQVISLIESSQMREFSIEEKTQLRQALSNEDVGDVEILYCRFIEEKTWAEISEQLGLHRNTLSKRVADSISRLREHFGFTSQDP